MAKAGKESDTFFSNDDFCKDKNYWVTSNKKTKVGRLISCEVYLKLMLINFRI